MLRTLMEQKRLKLSGIQEALRSIRIELTLQFLTRRKHYLLNRYEATQSPAGLLTRLELSRWVNSLPSKNAIVALRFNSVLFACAGLVWHQLGIDNVYRSFCQWIARKSGTWEQQNYASTLLHEIHVEIDGLDRRIHSLNVGFLEGLECDCEICRHCINLQEDLDLLLLNSIWTHSNLNA